MKCTLDIAHIIWIMYLGGWRNALRLLGEEAIRPVPERARHTEYCDNGRYDKGWNDCLDELLKDGV